MSVWEELQIDLGPVRPEKAILVLGAVNRYGPQTVDEFVTARDLYINSWAPTFTRLRQRGMLARTGESRTTQHGAPAYVVEITDWGKLVYKKLCDQPCEEERA